MIRLLVVAVCAHACAATLSLVPDGVRVESDALRTAQKGWTFEVSVDKPEAPPLAGSYRWAAGSVTFVPKYPLQAGLAYRAVFSLGSEKAAAVLVPAAAASQGPATYVEALFPTAFVLPENQLKLYVQFSAPMSRGEAFQRLHLIDLKTNVEVKLPFLEIDEELWDRDQKRLTVLFDPGRVKRGLVPTNEVGPPLVEGGKYRVVVDAEWRDANNRPLRQGYTKEYTVGAAWREGVDVRQWKLFAPKSGTREALVVDFPRSMDVALLQRCLSVEGVTGEIRVAKQEMRWLFTPDAPWAAKPHVLKVAEILEDLAGNKIGRAFDVDVFEKVDKSVATGTVRLPFTPSK